MSCSKTWKWVRRKGWSRSASKLSNTHSRIAWIHFRTISFLDNQKSKKNWLAFCKRSRATWRHAWSNLLKKAISRRRRMLGWLSALEPSIGNKLNDRRRRSAVLRVLSLSIAASREDSFSPLWRVTKIRTIKKKRRQHLRNPLSHLRAQVKIYPVKRLWTIVSRARNPRLHPAGL